MKAILYTQYGPPDVLHLSDVPKPVPGDDDVLMRVRAVAVTTGDVNARGFTFVPPGFGPVPRLMFGWKVPRQQILGADFAGEVVVAGKNVKDFRPGEKVFGTTGAKFGAYAELVCVPASGVIAKMPEGLSFEEGAGAFFGGHTALYFLRDKGNIQPGQRVLVNGASGGVGTFGVQLAKYFGAHVTGVCSAGNMDMVRSLGADEVIDYTQQDPIGTGAVYDLILDTKGTLAFGRAKQAMVRNGRLLAVAGGPREFGQMFLSSFGGGKKIVGGAAGEHREDLLFLRDLLGSKKLKVVIDKVYSLEQTAEAHRYVDSGHKRGSVVIRVG